MFHIPDPSQLIKQGGNLFGHPDADAKKLPPADAELRSGFVERANVDPATATRARDLEHRLGARTRAALTRLDVLVEREMLMSLARLLGDQLRGRERVCVDGPVFDAREVYPG